MVSPKFLKDTNIFKFCSDRELEKLAAIAVTESYPAGALLYKEGDPAHHVYIVEEGKVFLEMKTEMGPHRPPMQVTVDVITKGEAMGWSAIVEPYIYTLGALAMENCKLIAFEAGKLRELCDADPALSCSIMKGTAKLLALRLDHTRILLVGERALSFLTGQTEYA
jgi:CRP-like cAMP-binding protein